MSKAVINSIASENPFANRLIFENGKYVAFGNDQFSDLVKIGNAPKVKGRAVYQDGTILSSPGSEFDGLHDKVYQLADPGLIGSVRIQPYQIKFIHKINKVFNATHVKFHGDENGIFVNFFDLLKSIPEARMNRKHETRLLTHHLKTNPVEPFEMTFNAGSFNLLPQKSFHIGFGDNKIGIFSQDDSEDLYLLRDPEVVQPVINFFSGSLDENITLTINSKMSLISENLDNEEFDPDANMDYQGI